MAQTRSKSFQFAIDGTVHQVTLIGDSGHGRVRIGGREFEIQALPVSPNCLSLRLDGRSVTVYLAGEGTRRFIGLAGRQLILEESRGSSADPARRQAQASRAEGNLSSPMPGQVVKILVCEGDMVDKNQTVAIVEAMKMENELKASGRARVKKISAQAGDLVDAGQVIVKLEAD